MKVEIGQRFFDIVARGRLNTPEEWQEYLEAFHRDLPHANELFTLLRRHSGETSYGVLAHAVAAVRPARVLDAGCGDGNLIDELLRVLPESTTIDGIDSSPTEIAITHDRYAREPRVAAIAGDLRSLPYVDGTFDCVAAHQVLNLFPNIHPVLSEISRVLRPGGMLAVIANRGWRKDQTANWQLFNQAALGVIKQKFPEFVWPKMGDMRIYDPDGIEAIFAESGGWDVHTLSIETFNTRALMAPRQVAAIYNRLYLFATMPEKKDVLDAVEARAAELGSHDLVEVDLPFRLIRIARSLPARSSSERPT